MGRRLIGLVVVAVALWALEACAAPAEITNPKDGSVLVRVPAGPFTMGSDSEKPPHTVTLKAFYIGKYDVSNEQWKKFVTATGYTAAGDWQTPARAREGRGTVVNLSWYDATAYCQWAGLRLPTEAEWEKAARGTDQRKYPWGNDWKAGDKDYRQELSGKGVSPYGCHDMVGYFMQWTSSEYKPYPYSATDGRENPRPSSREVARLRASLVSAQGKQDPRILRRVLRGGSWSDGLNSTCCSRVYYNPDYSFNAAFRCAKSL